MAFQSIHFAIFLFCLAVAVALFTKSNASKKNLLLLASYYFYACWDWRFIFLLGGLSVFNFYVGKKIYDSANRSQRKGWLAISLLGSLGTLCYFKYANFFSENLDAFIAMLGLTSHDVILQVLLPVGISFYTFQCLSYTLDIYKGTLKPITSLRDFALFVAFFPQLVAGPIVRAKDFLPQLSKLRTPTGTDVETGFMLICRGLIKKLIFADVLAVHIVDPAFHSPGAFSSFFLLIAIFAYSLQVYFDFSAYTDIARGTARILGYNLPENFLRPYKAQSVSNFWQRWHISMSSFFRDYLFFALGGSKKGNVYFNLMVTFIAIGVWHGAGWNFVVYGLIHGALVGMERYFRNKGNSSVIYKCSQWLPTVIRIIWVFFIVSLARVLFRAGPLEDGATYLDAMFNSQVSGIPLSWLGSVIFVLGLILHYIPRSNLWQLANVYRRLPIYIQASILFVLSFAFVIVGDGSAPFIYFQF